MLDFLTAAVWFSWHDLKCHLIKRRHLRIAVLPLLPILDTQNLVIGLLNWLLYLSLYLLSSGSLGYGDVRLSLLIGFYIGDNDVSIVELLQLNFVGWIIALLAATIKSLFTSAPFSARIAFAPYLFLTAAMGFLIN